MGAPAPPGVAASGVPPLAERGNVGANAVIEGVIAGVGPGKAFAFWGAMNLALWASFLTTLTTVAGVDGGTLAAATNVGPGNSLAVASLPRGTTVGANVAGAVSAFGFPAFSLNGTIQSGVARISDLASTDFLEGAAVTTGDGIPAGTTVVAVVTPAVNGRGGVISISQAATANTPPLGGNQPFTFQTVAAGVDAGTTLPVVITGDTIISGDGSGSTTVQLERSFDGGVTWIVCNVGGNGQLAQFTAGSPVSLSFAEPERNVLYRLNCIAYDDIAGVSLNYRLSATGPAALSLSVPTL